MPITIDVNNFRKNVLKQLRGANDKFVIYYDEINNIRKLHLKKDGPNDKSMKNFVLGGIAHRALTSLTGEAELRSALRIQESAVEFKFEHIAKGDYMDVLNSGKLTIIFNYLLKSHIYIHYTNLNIVYWSLVDIIESLLTEKRLMSFAAYHREIKNEFYAIVTKDILGFLDILGSYGYPNIDRQKTGDFASAVLELLNTHAPAPRTVFDGMLKSLLTEAAKLDELAFLVNHRENILIDSLHDYFVRPMYIFKKSTHIFDEELTVQQSLRKFKFMNGPKEISFSFRDSKTTFGIQLSDVVCGLLGKHFNFIEEHSMSDLLQKKASFNDTQQTNLNLLAKLINVSDTISNGFVYRTAPLDSDFKHESFTFNHSCPPYLN
ncbi:DUF3800 domain-containing protein [Glaciimonas sp. CA11.2]|uniref:DUF3800 domain-containing protein n=1 Tax=Glaciimonas sp. CA11.2 TaxID=3048601 RepID=UPI002AB35779|nr:DUF3800 domain-containing protein [Glaciimonas sp. CA11.2]MDY7546811.1 DUF3800 domain-containing protein [Glaciimonas sp. CA11.2]MEB0164479.1 DUF3800 domain-containing protein [Glaciimonas sp. CA11.2]